MQNSNDVVVEQADEGEEDIVFSTATYTLSDNIEKLTLTGLARINGTGNALNNVITSNGIGSTLSGRDGDDTYYVFNAKDVVVESAGEGTDRIVSTVTYKLGAHVENLILETGAGNINATGNELNNRLAGNEGRNTLLGGAGNDILDGGEGNDLLNGGDGDDTYYVDSSADVIKDSSGIDTVFSTVDYTLATGLENLVLTDSAVRGTGNAQSNTISGNDGDNILDGAAGADTMSGGEGNDTYYIDNAGDVVIDTGAPIVQPPEDKFPPEAGDLVISAINYALGGGIEHLTLSGKTAINGTGNAGNNRITGNDGVNRLYGLAGHDILDGGKGADTLFGGEGNDVYYVDSTGDVVTEYYGEGYDTVMSSVSYTLSTEVEALTLTGTAAKIATGNALDNLLVGNAAANTLIGNAGNDTMNGGAGADRMVGGTGDDVYYVDNVKDVIVELAGEGTDTVYSALSYVLGAELENLRLLSELEGADKDLNATGNASDNEIYGNRGNNTLDGGAGMDFMVGGEGNDTYIVDNIGDTVLEYADEGIDTVRASVNYRLSVNIENLTLTGTGNLAGTGNVLDNVMMGNAGNNTLYGQDGHDTIDGGLGADTMYGGVGNDTYYVDNTLDAVIETADEGIDTVISSVSYTLGFEQENLVLSGKAALNGTGNALNNYIVGNTAVNILNGGDGDDTLDGGLGADTMIGGVGNDTFYIDNTKDVIIENVGEGNDTVVSAFTYTLGSHFENLTLLEGVKGKLNAFGNAAVNILTVSYTHLTLPTKA